MERRKLMIGAGTALLIAAIALVALNFLDQPSKDWKDLRGKLMPQFAKIELKNNVDIITRSFSPDLDIGVVISVGSKYQFISQEDIDAWGIDEETLFDTAMSNLDANSRNINVEVAEAAENDETAKYVIVELGDGFSAVRILSGGVRRAISREVGDEYFVAIPTRDFLIVWHKDFPLADAFTQQVLTEYESEKEYPLTPNLFLVNSYGIQSLMKVEPGEEVSL